MNEIIVWVLLLFTNHNVGDAAVGDAAIGIDDHFTSVHGAYHTYDECWNALKKLKMEEKEIGWCAETKESERIEIKGAFLTAPEGAETKESER